MRWLSSSRPSRPCPRKRTPRRWILTGTSSPMRKTSAAGLLMRSSRCLRRNRDGTRNRGDCCSPGQQHMRGEPACRPGSVRPLARGGGHPSGTAVAGSLVRSTREPRAGRPRTLAQGTVVPLLDLAPGGVYQAAAVTCGAGGLLHHRFTLTPARAGAVCFLWHCPAGHPGSALPTTLPCGARTFLAGLAPGATARPTHPCSGYAERRRAGADDRTPAGECCQRPERGGH
jgi:hypothetical protein